MSVGDTLHAISQAGLTLEASEAGNTLKVYPGEGMSPELAAAIKEHKVDIIRILREDELMLRTGVIQSEQQVFELAREFFSLNEKEGAS